MRKKEKRGAVHLSLLLFPREKKGTRTSVCLARPGLSLDIFFVLSYLSPPGGSSVETPPLEDRRWFPEGLFFVRVPALKKLRWQLNRCGAK
jgi:hypothetical protein